MIQAKYDEAKQEITLVIKVHPPEASNSGKMDLIYTSGGFKDMNISINGRTVRGNITLGHSARNR